MTRTVREIEEDIAATRARLDRTIDSIQDRLSVSGIVDELMGTVRRSERLGLTLDRALHVLRRNPVPVLLFAAGAGWLIRRLSDEAELRGERPRRDGARPVPDPAIPVMNAGPVHVYDPDSSPLHPTHDRLESRREMSARA
jgi:uncharacterized protein DUF3618